MEEVRITNLNDALNIIKNYIKNYSCKPCYSTLNASVALSGGIDSSTLFALFRLAGFDFEPVIVKTELLALRNLIEAVNIVDRFGSKCNDKLKIIEIKVDRRVLKNDDMRCYYCKKQMMSEILSYYDLVFDGTNFDDLKSLRPGLKAIRELGVKSPLAELRLGKGEIRKIASYIGIPDKPSDSCLATRIKGKITEKKLKIVEQAEDIAIKFLERINYRYTRLRVYLSDGKLLLEIIPFNKNVTDKILTLLSEKFSKNFSIGCISKI